MWKDAWPSQEIQNLERRLLELEQLVAHPPHGQADDVSNALARFLVVRACGFLEQVVDESCMAFISSKSAPQVSNFISGFFGRGSNPTPDRLLMLVERFDRSWSAELEDYFAADDELVARDLALLVDRRNKIAHGLSEGMGARKALDLTRLARDLADWFVLRLDSR